MKKFGRITLLAVTLLVFVVSLVFAANVVEFSITPELAGFSDDNATLHYVEQEIFPGSTGCIEVNLGDKTWGSLRVRPIGLDDAHVNWPTDWTQYDIISVMVYFDEFDTAPDKNTLDIRIRALEKSDWARYLINKNKLNLGWNLVEVDLIDLMGVRVDELRNMTDPNILEVTVNKLGSFYIKDIKLIKK